MIASLERPDVRISIRVDPDLYDEVERVAKDRYEGKFSMAARAAFRLLVNEPSVARAESEREELAVAS